MISRGDVAAMAKDPKRVRAGKKAAHTRKSKKSKGNKKR